MTFLEPIKNYLNKLDLRTFYIYLASYAGTCIVLLGLMTYYYYSSLWGLQKKINNVNSHREDILTILEKKELIKQQQAAVEAILAQDPNFKIEGYFEKLLTKFNLSDKKDSRIVTTIDLEGNYRKSELSAKFENMTMQDLTTLLEEIEKNPRIATDKLEITKSKTPKTIVVDLTISTLLPKIETSSV